MGHVYIFQRMLVQHTTKRYQPPRLRLPHQKFSPTSYGNPASNLSSMVSLKTKLFSLCGPFYYDLHLYEVLVIFCTTFPPQRLSQYEQLLCLLLMCFFMIDFFVEMKSNCSHLKRLPLDSDKFSSITRTLVVITQFLLLTPFTASLSKTCSTCFILKLSQSLNWFILNCMSIPTI